MSTATPSPVTAAYSPALSRPPLPTPSPLWSSAVSTRWSSRPPIQTTHLFLRFVAFVLSAASAISLATVTKARFARHRVSFWDHPEFVYCFSVNIVEFVYAAYQLFKGTCDVVDRGIFISDRVSDFISFFFDQVSGYLLISASSVAVPAINELHNGNPLKKAATVSICLSFTLFAVLAASALISSYTLCKRIT